MLTTVTLPTSAFCHCAIIQRHGFGSGFFPLEGCRWEGLVLNTAPLKHQSYRRLFFTVFTGLCSLVTSVGTSFQNCLAWNLFPVCCSLIRPLKYCNSFSFYGKIGFKMNLILLLFFILVYTLKELLYCIYKVCSNNFQDTIEHGTWN